MVESFHPRRDGHQPCRSPAAGVAGCGAADHRRPECPSRCRSPAAGVAGERDVQWHPGEGGVALQEPSGRRCRDDHLGEQIIASEVWLQASRCRSPAAGFAGPRKSISRRPPTGELHAPPVSRAAGASGRRCRESVCESRIYVNEHGRMWCRSPAAGRQACQDCSGPAGRAAGRCARSI